MSAKEYLEKAVPVVEERQDLPRGVTQPLPMNYHPELDDSPLLGDVDAQLYMSYIGILQWAMELGRIDVALPVSTMARYMACPRHGHMKHVLQIVAFLKSHLNLRLVLDPMAQDWSDKEWVSADWSEFYPDVEEIITRI